MVAFGGLNWSLDGASAPVAAVLSLRRPWHRAGALTVEPRHPARLRPAMIRIRNLTFAYPGASEKVFDGLDLTIPAGTSLAIVGRNGAGKTTLAKLLCRLYDPQHGAIEVDGNDLRDLDRRAPGGIRSPPSSRTSSASSCPCGTTSRPAAHRTRTSSPPCAMRVRTSSPSLDTPLAKGYDGGTDLSGGQWQRVALARALCAVRQGARLVLLDEPTAQLDVRGEAEIFERILAATRGVTTILISHRFSTVRHADRICVLEQGRVIELGTPRRADGARRPLPDDVRPAGPAVQRGPTDEEGVSL